MDNYNYCCDNDEAEIDIIDLIRELFKHWKSIILCAFIFMVLGGAFSVLKAHTSADELDMVSEAEEEEKDPEEIEADIKKDYELLTLQYEDDVKLYDMKSDIFEEYSTAVSMLGHETDRLADINEKEEEIGRAHV